jgi:hypothetical protein
VRRRFAAAAVLLAAASLPSTAAPLDAMLSARLEREAGGSARGWMEAAVSGVNRRIDFSDPEDDPDVAARSTQGDYRDLTLSGAWQVREGWWLLGGLARREVSNGVDTYRFLGWQLAGQVRLMEARDGRPALAVRVGAWGHQASETATTTPVRVPGAILDTVTVHRPSDRTLQADLIASWDLTPALELGLFAGIGHTQLSYAGLRATTTRNGCHYDLQFTGNDIYGTLAEPCDVPGGVIEQFFDSSGDYGVDVPREIAWSGRFAQLGANLRWRSGPWTVGGGLLWHAVDRDGVDDILAGRGRPVHQRNLGLVLDVDHRFGPRWSLFGRAQLSQRLFFNDLPVTYNSSTSGSFGSRLSLLTVGLRARF